VSCELYTNREDTDASMLYWVPSPSVNISSSVVRNDTRRVHAYGSLR